MVTIARARVIARAEVDPLSQVWSSGIWTVKAGRADEFIEAWQAFADWSNATHGPTFAWLLRRRDRPDEFESIGPWPDDTAMAAWRADPEFARRIGRLRDLVDAFEARTFDQLAAVETAPKVSRGQARP